jgi:hypothetical protein
MMAAVRELADRSCGKVWLGCVGQVHRKEESVSIPNGRAGCCQRCGKIAGDYIRLGIACVAGELRLLGLSRKIEIRLGQDRRVCNGIHVDQHHQFRFF